MRLLAIETATADCSVALALGGEVRQAIAEPEASGRGKPSEQVPQLVRALLAQAGCGLSSLDAIVFDCGPGTFTGIRIGCGLAQGMALGAGLPLLGLSSLRVLAMQAPAGRVLALLDARMHEIYWGLFQREGLGSAASANPLADARVDAPRDWQCPADVEVALGDGLAVALHDGQRLAARLPSSVRLGSTCARPRAIDMLPLARADLAAGLAQPPELASPLYVRNKVALTAAEQLARRVTG